MNQARGHVNLISDCEPFKSLLWVLFTCSSGVLSVEVEVEKRHLPSTCPISLFNLIPVVRVDNQNPSLTLKESPLISFFCTVLMWSAWSQNVYKRQIFCGVFPYFRCLNVTIHDHVCVCRNIQYIKLRSLILWPFRKSRTGNQKAPKSSSNTFYITQSRLINCQYKKHSCSINFIT